MDREAWWATVHKGHKESDMTEVTLHARTHTSFGCLAFLIPGIQM